MNPTVVMTNDGPRTVTRERRGYRFQPYNPTAAARERAWSLATYYAWCARRRHPIGGNDPLTGRPWGMYDPGARDAGRVAYTALARYWFSRAREQRVPLP